MQSTKETKGFIPLSGFWFHQSPVTAAGQHHDPDTGLIFLNARYYDPALGLFAQPDWFEVTRRGVGTNRYSYAYNDPVNLRDPGGNAFDDWGMSQKEADAHNAQKAEAAEKAAESARSNNSLFGRIARAFGAVGRAKQEAKDRQSRIGVSVLGRVAIDLGHLVDAVPPTPAKAGALKMATALSKKGIVKTTKTLASKALTDKQINKMGHIFGQKKHNMQALIDKFGTEEKAFRALEKAAQKALDSKSLSLRSNGVHKTSRISVGGIKVGLIGGRAINGIFELGSASRKGL